VDGGVETPPYKANCSDISAALCMGRSGRASAGKIGPLSSAYA
jgi:hypothetical protein